MKRKHSQAEHTQQKSDGKNDRETCPKVFPRNDAKRWMTILLIFGAIAFGIAAMLGIFAHSRGSAIWCTWFGVVLFITAAFVWFQGLGREHEVAPQISKSDLTQAITPKPTIPITTIPAPQSPSPTVNDRRSTLTPSQIVKEVRAARPFQRDEIAQTFVGIPVEWLLIFASATRLPGRDENDTRWKLLFEVSGEDSGRIVVGFEIPSKGSEYLRGVDKGEMFKVKGTIKSVWPELSAINLDNVSFEHVSAP